jgi:hypothetical protein
MAEGELSVSTDRSESELAAYGKGMSEGFDRFRGILHDLGVVVVMPIMSTDASSGERKQRKQQRTHEGEVGVKSCNVAQAKL